MLLTERPRVLVADDERIVADTLATILNQSGYESVPVYGGRLAVEKPVTGGSTCFSAT